MWGSRHQALLEAAGRAKQISSMKVTSDINSGSTSLNGSVPPTPDKWLVETLDRALQGRQECFSGRPQEGMLACQGDSAWSQNVTTSMMEKDSLTGLSAGPQQSLLESSPEAPGQGQGQRTMGLSVPPFPYIHLLLLLALLPEP